MTDTSNPVSVKTFPGNNSAGTREAIKSASRRGYRIFAPLYDFVFGLSLHHGRKIAISALAARPDERILEVGVGSGMSLPMYPPNISVLGIDTSNEMLEKARHRLARKHLSGRHALLQMDVEQMSFADNSFDKAVLMYAVSGFPDPAGAIKAIQRVCKPGATVIVVNRFASRHPLARCIDMLLNPLFKLLEYRGDLNADKFLEESNLELLERKPCNLFGYSTVLVCRTRKKPQPGNEVSTIPVQFKNSDMSEVYKWISNTGT